MTITNILNSISDPRVFLGSFGVAGICRLFNSPALSKIQEAATIIGIAGVAVYWYLHAPSRPSHPSNSTEDGFSSENNSSVSSAVESSDSDKSAEEYYLGEEKCKTHRQASDDAEATRAQAKSKSEQPARFRKPLPTPVNNFSPQGSQNVQKRKRFSAGLSSEYQAKHWEGRDEQEFFNSRQHSQLIPQQTLLKSASNTGAHPNGNVNIVKANKTQYDVQNGRSACTAIAGIALIKMLKMEEKEQPTPESLDFILEQGAERYAQLSNYLQSQKFQVNDQDAYLSWDQCYLGAGSLFKFSDELQTSLNTNNHLLEIPIQLTQDENNSDEYFNALQQIEKKALRTKKAQGGILIMTPETYAVSVSPNADGKTCTIRFFDSHGSSAFSNKAAMFEFTDLRTLAIFLKMKKKYEPDLGPEYNRCGLYRCCLH